jgi:plastocyanin
VIRGILLLAAALLLGPAASASAADVAIGIPARYFLPSSLQVVVGDTVSWHNSDHDTHNLVAVDGEFDSGRLGTGASFEHAFDTVGDRPYLCTIHPSMTGEVDVVPIALSGPGAPPTAGERFALDGRAPVGSGPLALQRAATTDGPFRDVAAVPAGPDGAFTIPLTAEATAAWRITGAPGASPPVTVPVAPRIRLAVKAHLTRSLVVLSVRTHPVRPGETVALQLYSRERFAWLPAGRARLDESGAITFSVRRGLRRVARVAYAHDGAVVHSRSIRLWRVAG